MEAKKLNEAEAQVQCITPAKAWTPTMTTEEHQAIVDAKAPLAEALDEREVKKPDRPIANVLEEGFAFVRAARGVQRELEAVGLECNTISDYEGFLFALMSAHVITGGWRSNRRTEVEREAVTEGKAVHADVGAAARLVLRGTPAADRVAALLAVTGEAELVPAMLELSTIVTSNEAPFAENRLDARKLAGELAAAAEKLRAVLAEEEGARRLDGGHDLRDRLYTLASSCLDELRARAEYAFRHDPNPRRRELFVSEYVRTRNRKSRTKQQGEPAPRVAGPEGGEGEQK